MAHVHAVESKLNARIFSGVLRFCEAVCGCIIIALTVHLLNAFKCLPHSAFVGDLFLHSRKKKTAIYALRADGITSWKVFFVLLNHQSKFNDTKIPDTDLWRSEASSISPLSDSVIAHCTRISVCSVLKIEWMQWIPFHVCLRVKRQFGNRSHRTRNTSKQ